MPSLHTNSVRPQTWSGEVALVVATRSEVGAVQALIGHRYAITYVAPSDTASMEDIREMRPQVVALLSEWGPKRIMALGKVALSCLINKHSSVPIPSLRGRDIPLHELIGELSTCRCTYGMAEASTTCPEYIQYIKDDLACTHPVLTYPESMGSIGASIAVDTEYTPDHQLLDMAVATTRGAMMIDASYQFPPTIKYLAGHHVWNDLDFILDHPQAPPACEQWVQGKQIYDSLILAKMADENFPVGGYKLENLLHHYFIPPSWKQATDDYGDDARNWPAELRRTRCQMDAWASAVLVKHLLPLAQGPVELTHRIAASLHRVRHAGVMIEKQALRTLTSSLGGTVQRLNDRVTKMSLLTGMASFSPSKDNDIRTLLFEKLRYTPLGETPSGKRSVDKKVLKQLARVHPTCTVLQDLIAYNESEKLYHTNIVGMQEYLVEAGEHHYRLPTNINIMGARTARRSSSSPNMQNWAPSIKQLVVSRFKGGKILSVDFKSLEMVLLAYVSGDDKLMQCFTTGKGYIGVAKEIFGYDVEKGSTLYVATKGIVLGTSYGLGASKMAETLWSTNNIKLSDSREEHDAIVRASKEKYLKAYSGIRAYMSRQGHHLLDGRGIYSYTGRQRRLTLPHGNKSYGYGHALNASYNFPIQSLASDITGASLVGCEESIVRRSGVGYQQYARMLKRGDWPVVPLPINEVHDELVFDVPGEDQKAWVELIVEEMKSQRVLKSYFPDFSLTLAVEASCQDTWGKA